MTIGITGPGYELEYVVNVDRYGMFSGMFGGTAPAGEYSLRASGRGGVASAVLRVGGAV